jgi:hypothetical protein
MEAIKKAFGIASGYICMDSSSLNEQKEINFCLAPEIIAALVLSSFLKH